MGRTKKIIQLSVPENPSKIKGSRAGGYRIATVISSQGRYNHFDTAACAPLLYWILPKKSSAMFPICLI